MRALTLNEPGQFSWSDVAAPAGPGPGEVLLRTRAVGICGTDLHAFKGRQPFFTYPRILGHELAVEVLAVGEGVVDVAVGDLCAVNPYLNCGTCIACRRGKTNCCASLNVIGVHSDGGMREQFVLPATHVYPSTKLTVPELALVETLGIGCHAVHRAQPEATDKALVIGAGPIGCTVMEFLRLAGTPFDVLDLSPSRRAFATAQMKPAAVHESKDSVLAQTDLPTLVFDCTGNPHSMHDAFHLVAPGGKLIFVGLFIGDITFHDPNPFHRREMTILSSRNATAKEHRYILSAMETKRIETKAWISELCPAEGMVDRFPVWTDPGSGILKAVVDWK